MLIVDSCLLVGVGLHSSLRWGLWQWSSVGLDTLALLASVKAWVVITQAYLPDSFVFLIALRFRTGVLLQLISVTNPLVCQGVLVRL